MKDPEAFKIPATEWTDADVEDVSTWLYKHFKDHLVHFACRFIRGSPTLAEEVVQDKIGELAGKRFRSYDPNKYKGSRCPFRAWLFLAVARAANRRRKHEECIRRVIRILRPAASFSDPTIQRKQICAQIKDVAGLLTVEGYEALYLYYCLELTNEQAAQRAGCQPGCMKVRRFRALRRALQLLRDRNGTLPSRAPEIISDRASSVAGTNEPERIPSDRNTAQQSNNSKLYKSEVDGL